VLLRIQSGRACRHWAVAQLAEGFYRGLGHSIGAGGIACAGLREPLNPRLVETRCSGRTPRSKRPLHVGRLQYGGGPRDVAAVGSGEKHARWRPCADSRGNFQGPGRCCKVGKCRRGTDWNVTAEEDIAEEGCLVAGATSFLAALLGARSEL
jgi:hypothetical protein